MDLIKHDENEDLWGYAKRLRFVRRAIEDVFASREAARLRILEKSASSDNIICNSGCYVSSKRDN